MFLVEEVVRANIELSKMPRSGCWTQEVQAAVAQIASPGQLFCDCMNAEGPFDLKADAAAKERKSMTDSGVQNYS